MLAMMRYDAVDVLPTILVPVLIIAANHDKAILLEASHFITRKIPYVEEVMLAPGGHLDLLEQHSDWLKAVEAFAKRCLA